MANIALDIKANTQKALGEFKKLSRELDNKFLVQGLKLDVVKSAFSQINREFQNAVGTQGLKTAETTGQLKRSLSAALFDLGRFNTEASAKIASGEIVSALQKLRAEGEITGETFREALNISAFLDFDATGAELQNLLSSTTNDIAQFVQKSSDLFGGNQGQLLLKGITGQLTTDQLSDLDFNLGGNTNQILGVFRKYQGQLRSLNAVTRTEGITAAVAELQALEIFDNTLAEIRPIEFVFRKIGGLFSETGVFGALRVVGGVIENFDGTAVNRNLLQVTGKLLRTIFDTKEGIFAKLNQALQKAFGNFDVLEPILSGAEFLTGIFEKIGNFFESPEFQVFLNIFDGVVDSFKDIFSGGGFDFSVENINGLIDEIFNVIRDLISKVVDFIRGIDAGAIGSVLGNIIEEILKTLPSLFTLIISALGKAVQVAFSNPTTAIVAAIAGGLGGVSILDRLLGGVGLRGEAMRGLRGIAGGGRGIRGIIPGQNEGLAQYDRVSGQRLDGFQSAVLDYMRAIIRQLGVQDDPISSGENETRRRRRRPQSSQRAPRTTPRNPVTRFLRGGIGNPGGFINRTLIGPRRIGPNAGQAISPELSARFARRFGTRGVLTRGLPMIANAGMGAVGAALGALQLGSIFAGAGRRDAQIDADDRLSPEEKELLKNKNRESARQQAGAAAIGMAGTALGGVLGSFIGGPVGTFIGAQIGGVFGEAIANILGPGVTEAVGGFVGDIGNFFKNLWDGAVGLGRGFVEGFKNFFGPEGPIQSIGRFLYEIPGNIMSAITENFEKAKEALVDLPGNIVNSVLSIFGGNDNQAADIDRERNSRRGSAFDNEDDIPGRFLGGAGRGMTLVGENGPELVNLGSGANVIPNSSLMGGLFGNLQSQRASAPVTNIVTINVNAPGADEFAETLRDNVIIELNNQFEQLSTG